MISIVNQEKGFTLIEAFTAQIMLIIVALAVYSAFVAGSRYNAESEDKTIATTIAQLKMEEIMNTRFRYIVNDHPAGETRFDSLPKEEPYWTLNSEEEWITSLPEGRYEISYPGTDGEDADPLNVEVTVWWDGQVSDNSSVELRTFVSMTPGRFR